MIVGALITAMAVYISASPKPPHHQALYEAT
jgi:hypothetical protein